MNNTVRNIIGVVLGIVVGGFVNMSIVGLSGQFIPLPEGVNPEDMESIKQGMHLFQPKHFIMPFIAHAMGAFTGALVAALIAGSHKMRIAIGIGIFTLIGGIAAVFMLPGSPIWFILLDLIVAYIPMSYLAGKLATMRKASS